MQPGTRHWDRVGCSRRRLLSALTVAGVGGIAGCSGLGGDTSDEADATGTDDGDSPSSTASQDDEEGSAESSSGTGDGCPEWSSLSPYDVSGTDFVVVPSFPTEWTQYNETYIESFVEVRFGYPETLTESGTSYPDFVAITQVTDAVEKDSHEPVIEQGLYERAAPVVIDGEEFVVGREELAETVTRWHLTAPSTRGTYHVTTVLAEAERDTCVEDMTTLGRSVVDSLEVNPSTTL